MKTTIAIKKDHPKVLAANLKKQAPKAVNSKIVIGELEGKIVEHPGCWDSDFN